ncbi:alpha-hydroxy-acid oxidizing protein [SAR202 cluster bacterium AD-802-E10_MRT_200m]|nr:alpha-hydroxy-acid oxidizing protein [SAR202 cluster bacterium AD-802-E10_MRT_200m]
MFHLGHPRIIWCPFNTPSETSFRNYPSFHQLEQSKVRIYIRRQKVIKDFVTVEEVIVAARNNVSLGAWGYLSGGSESETTLRRNRSALDRVAFRPRILRDVSSIDTSTTILGHKVRIPLLLAPIGSQQVFTPEGAIAATKAANEFGALDVISSVAEPSLEEIAAAADNPKIFQLYLHGDWEWTKSMLARIESSGYSALCITVDTARPSRRDRTMLARWSPRANFLASGSLNSHQVSGGKYGANASTVTWETIDRIKELIKIPLIIKGVATAEDAALALNHNFDMVWVSNHGGRQLDHGLGTIDTLPEIVDAIKGKVPIIVDGGIQRGTDILKSIALGADAVAIGKLQCWGLAAAGSEGLVRVLEILEDELICAMALLGVTSMDELSSEYVCRAEAVTNPHEMSSWVNIPGNRIL